MLVVISPAKKLDMQPFDDCPSTQPLFEHEVRELVETMRNLSSVELRSLMGISENLARLNADRFSRFGSQNKNPAVFTFAGDTYLGLDAPTLAPEAITWAQNHLRVLSGLYGILRPLDEIEPYRLEMGSRLATAEARSLYQYWGTKISDALNTQAETTKSGLLVNCASKEYFGAVDLATLEIPIVTPVFMENKNGKTKIISFHAKKARGAMARFIVQNKLTDKEDLKDFKAGGYRYQPDQSNSDSLVFIR